MKKQHIPEDLIKRYLGGTATEEEKALVESWHLQDFVKSDAAPDEDEITQVHAQMRQTLLRHATPVRKLNSWYRYAAAASIIVFFSIGGYFALHQPKPQEIALLKPGTYKNDALPGNKAILTLANGQKIVISEAKNGTIAHQGATNISKTANGNIIYAATTKNAEITYNTYSVPRGGGKHSLVLADGTLAVLDAGSSIHYPTAFTGKERKVEITGQVYFEVIHNVAQPFFVTAKGQTIEDIGTHFNINAFDDEPDVKTTLIEGSIKVAGILLRPGQQAISDNGKLNVLDNVNTEEVVAWKNDLFMFTKNTTLPIVMKQLSRWYDLEVVYEGIRKTYHFGGDMPRNSKLSDVLKILTYSGVQFSVDGKKIIVYQ